MEPLRSCFWAEFLSAPLENQSRDLQIGDLLAW